MPIENEKNGILEKIKLWFDIRKQNQLLIEKVAELEEKQKIALEVLEKQKDVLELQFKEITKLRKKLNGEPILCSVCGKGGKQLKKIGGGEYICYSHFLGVD